MPPLETQVPLAPYTTLNVGGAAEFLVRVHTEAELQAVCMYAEQQELPLTVLGGGSNVLVGEAGVPGITVRIELCGREYQTQDGYVLATFAAGEELDVCVAETVAMGYWGLENLSYIPGSVGATPIQNVGAYGVEIADVVWSVRVYDRVRHTSYILTSDECRFGYRDSRFKQEPDTLVVTAVTYRLETTANPRLHYQGLQDAGLTATSSLAEIRQTIGTIRAGKFPDWRVVGTAGSFFKNPIIATEAAAALLAAYPEVPTYPAENDMIKVSLGYILDKVCGLRGYREGAVALYERQALVLVAYEGATAAEVDRFARVVAEQVFEKTGIVLEREVTQIGL